MKRATTNYHTWYDEVNDKVVLSIKGTSTAKDMKQTWGGIGFRGRNSNKNPYVKGAQAELDRIKELYPDAVIEVTGHSLGGNVAQVLRMENPDVVSRAVAINPGLVRLMCCKWNIYQGWRDPLTAGTNTGRICCFA